MGFALILWSICINAILLLWCGSCMSFAHSDSPRSNETDRLALLAFKARITHDPFHLVITHWNDSVSHCEWPGILCGGRRHRNRVIALSLQASGLEGSLAPEIGNISFLREIHLENNSFNGEIPHEVSFLFRLRYLNLSYNSFDGEILPNISHCSNLIELDISYNNLVGTIPVELGTMSKLQVMSIHDNNLKGQIPSSFGNLSSLYSLIVRQNYLSGSIPNSLGQMTRLMHLSLGENKLSGTIPPSIYNLSSVSYFDVVGNQLQGSLSPNLGYSFPNLWWLGISENQFHGPIPISVSNLSKLEYFFAQNNTFTKEVAIHFGGLLELTGVTLANNHLGIGEAGDLSFINTMTNCSRLNHLHLQGNMFGGVLPNSIANLSTQLIKLSLSENQISGNIPIGIGNLVSLQYLSLLGNFLEGRIPTSIGRLQMLHVLYLNKNGLSGPIPSSIGRLILLIELNLQDNLLHGKIPSSLGKCKNLLRLGLSNNSFDGIIPEEIFGFPTLLQLELSRNYFSGSLPLEVGQLSGLEILDVSINMLSGQIPSPLGACTSLEHLFLECNLFQGSIPLSLSSLRGLWVLDLSHNNLSGFIPQYLGTLTLQNLNLSFNQLEGEVPTEGAFGNLSAFSVIGNNKLCGGIPALQLPACQIRKSKEVFKLIMTICICGAFLCLIFMIFLFIFYWRRKEREESITFFIRHNHFEISYAQLLQATNGFSSDNLIGVGSFGSVYKGILTHEETIVAVKVLNMEQRGASNSFMVECEALRNIRHRNLVKILTCCSSVDFQGNEFKALVYEFMPGGNLEQWLHPHANSIQAERRHLNFVQRLNIAIDTATALDYLHHHCHMQIIHCDLKPSNILLDENLIAHLSDFGISKILSKTTGGSQNHSSSIRIKGSIGYIAPEYGAGVGISTHGDIYSYGILLLEIFTRKRPIDEMFKDNFNLHNWAEMALHDEVVAIVDPSLFPIEEDEEEAMTTTTSIIGSRRCIKDKVRECLNLVIRIGVTCSNESPWDRMDINDVVKELHLIRDIYLEMAASNEDEA